MVASLDVPKDPQGRIKVDRRLQVVEANTDVSGTTEVTATDTAAASGGGGGGAAAGVYCLGDIAAVEGLDLPCNAQARVRGRGRT